MKIHAWIFTLCTTIVLSPINLANASESDLSSTYYIKPTFGISSMSDQTASINDVLEQTGQAEIELDTGFSSGIGFGYHYNDNWAFELGWEYRSNDSTSLLPNETFDEGNYASNLISANAYYFFSDNSSDFRFFAGAGVVYAQEIDIDLEKNGIERSFSGSGDIGVQAMAGMAYKLSTSWYLQTELRYISLSGVSLDAEENVTVGTFDELDYKPIDIQIAVRYQF